MGSHSYKFGGYSLDMRTMQLCRSGELVHLELTVLRLPVYLLENRDRPVEKDELLEAVWPETFVSESALTKAVGRLHEALDDDPAAPSYVETARGLGFRFIADVKESTSEDEAAIEYITAAGKTVATLRKIATVVLLSLASWRR